MQALLELGADRGAAADASGMVALHRAAARNHAGVLRPLLGAGADPWQRSAVGQTPLMHASQFEAAVGVLLAHLGDPSGVGSGSLQQAGMAGSAAASATAAAGVPECEADRQAEAQQTAREQQELQLQQQHAPAQDCQHQQQQGSTHLGNCGSTLRRHLGLCDTAGLTALQLAAQCDMAGVEELLLRAGAGGTWLCMLVLLRGLG